MTDITAHLKALAASIDNLLREEKYFEAEQIAKDLLTRNRSAGLAYLGVIALRTESYDLAEEYLVESYQINPSQNLALANLIPTYIKKRDSKKAVAYGELAYKAMPDSISTVANYAAALLQEQKFEKAAEILEKHLDEDNPHISIITGLISTYRSLFQKDKAEHLLEIAEKHFPDRHEVKRLRADNFAETDPEKALIAFETALLQDPKNIPTRWNMSLVQLRLGLFDKGWENYDNGLLPEVGKIGRPMPKLFEGCSILTSVDQVDKSKWTVAVCEQGIGDQVLFLGILDKFLSDFPKTALVCEKRMQPIIARSFPGVPILPYGIGPLLANQKNTTNGIFPIGSMQKIYRSTKGDFLAHRRAYIKPDYAKVERYKATLLEKTGGKRLVGFSWKGGFWERAQKTKTLEIELWGSFFDAADTIFVSLQYGDISREKDYLNKTYRNIRWIDGVDFKKDLDSWLALACACDDIVSVSTALVHFAGAAGKHVNLLLSDRGAPFIWGLEDSSAICYPSVDIYRKQRQETTDDFFKRIKKLVAIQ